MTATTRRSRLGLFDRVGWLLVLFTFAAALLPAPSVNATETICVALVVDFSPLGGNVDSGCTRVPSGATGYDVLKAGGHSYTVCNNGVIGEIDQQPANGCGIKDNNHFWGYWHRKPGSRTWTFSSYGAGFYHPGEGSTEGWVWEDGTTSPPADVAYPAGCHSPPQSPSPTPAPTQDSSSPAESPSAARTTTRASAGTGGAVHPGVSTTPRRTARPGAHVTAAASASPTTSPPSSSAGDIAVGSTTQGGTTERSASAGGSGSHVVPVVVGVAVAALLGAGAWWRAKRAGAS